MSDLEDLGLCIMQVSADGEETLYKALSKAGITMLSIAHRASLKKYHNFVVHFDGSQQGSGWRLEELRQGTSPASPKS